MPDLTMDNLDPAELVKDPAARVLMIEIVRLRQIVRIANDTCETYFAPLAAYAVISHDPAMRAVLERAGL